MDAWTSGTSEECDGIIMAMKKIGANVILEDEEGEKSKTDLPVDFTLIYINRETESDLFHADNPFLAPFNCGWTLIGFLLTWGLFPCVADLNSVAEVRILDEEGLLSEKKFFRTDARQFTGFLAPVLALERLANIKEYHRRRKEVSDHFIQYLQNMAVTYSMRKKISEENQTVWMKVKKGD